MRLSDQNLKGRTVISSDGQAIGEITSLFLDSEEWRVEAIQVGLRKGTADRRWPRLQVVPPRQVSGTSPRAFPHTLVSVAALTTLVHIWSTNLARRVAVYP